MTKINIMKRFSTALHSTVENQNNIKHVSLPLFKNPNSPIILSSAQRVDFPVKPKGSNSTSTQTSSSKLGQLPFAAVKAGAGHNLVFLKEKGSQTPNPNIISYNFPGALSQVNLKGSLSGNINKLMSNKVYNLLFHFFKSMYCLISKPVFINTPDRIKIQLFYFLCIPKILIDLKGPNSTSNLSEDNSLTSLNLSLFSQASASKAKEKRRYLQIKNFNSKDLNVKFNLNRLAQPDSNLTKVYPHKFKLICTILSKFFKKSVELELIRLHQPYYDSNILVNFLGLIINRKNIGAAIQRLYNSNIITQKGSATHDNTASKGSVISSPEGSASISQNSTAAYLSGLNIKISGRLMREPIIPRVTTKKFDKGFTAKGKINYLDVARFTHKNRKGAFTITVKSGQKFY